MASLQAKRFVTQRSYPEGKAASDLPLQIGGDDPGARKNRTHDREAGFCQIPSGQPPGSDSLSCKSGLDLKTNGPICAGLLLVQPLPRPHSHNPFNLDSDTAFFLLCTMSRTLN